MVDSLQVVRFWHGGFWHLVWGKLTSCKFYFFLFLNPVYIFQISSVFITKVLQGFIINTRTSTLKIETTHKTVPDTRHATLKIETTHKTVPNTRHATLKLETTHKTVPEIPDMPGMGEKKKKKPWFQDQSGMLKSWYWHNTASNQHQLQ